MQLLRYLALVALVLATGAFAAGCGGGDDDEDAAGTTGDTMAQEMAAEAGGGIEGPAVDLRLTLDRLLAEHAALATFAMQKGVAGEKDFEQIAAALEANTVDLGGAIGSVYGDEAEQSFLELWRDHIGFFVDFTVATAKGDEAGQNAARDELAQYQADFSAFLDSATGGELPADAAAEALQAHVTQLIAQIEAYAAEDYATAYEQQREAYAHMFMTGDALSGAISAQMPDMFGQGDVTQSAADLRVALGRLLGEHALLASFAMQKGYAGRPDFEQIAAALDGNTVDLGKAIGSVYGADAEEQFLELWRDHITLFVDLTVATAKKDDAARQTALDGLAAYRGNFADFLDSATGGELPADAAAEALQAHVDQLTTALDQYAAGDFAASYATVREAYAHMYMTADAIAGAIVAQSPDTFSS